MYIYANFPSAFFLK